MRWTRRKFLAGLGAVGLGAGACLASRRGDAPLGQRELDLVSRAWQGLDPSRVLDTHVHVVGLGADDSGCWVNPSMQSLTHPKKWLQFRLYTGAARIRDQQHADSEYMTRLRALMRDSN